MSATRQTRGVIKQYEEVESDIDMSDTERALGQGSNAEMNTHVSKIQEIESDSELSEVSDDETRPRKEQKREESDSEEKAEVIINSEKAKLSLLTSQSLDLIVLIFSRLDLETLIDLARINKEFQNLLVKSDVGTLLFRSMRIREGLPIFKGMSEIQFASLSFGSLCFECGDSQAAHNDLDPEAPSEATITTRVRLCNRCTSSDSLHDQKKFLKQLGDLHPRAKDASPHLFFANGSDFRITLIIDGKKQFIDKYLESISEELYALESEVRNQSRGSNRPGRGQRLTYTDVELLVKESVDSFIKEKRNRFRALKMESDSLIKAFEVKRTRREELAEAERQSDRRRRDRKANLRPYYDTYRDQKSKEADDTGENFLPFCTEEEFSQFDSVKPIWKLEGVVDVAAAFKAVELKIDQDLMEYRNNSRTAIILYILNSNSQDGGNRISTLPLPLASYDDNFFNLFTSQILFTAYIMGTNNLSTKREIYLSHHQKYLEINWEEKKLMIGRLGVLITTRMAIVARKILKAAKLDETASIADVENLNSLGKFVTGKDQKAIKKLLKQAENYISGQDLLMNFARQDSGYMDYSKMFSRYSRAPKTPTIPLVDLFSTRIFL